ncbi:MAG: PfaD family polyunsaturated fatty acid/polyketide biosynthesis protein [Dissulfuribacterales bacterium]
MIKNLNFHFKPSQPLPETGMKAIHQAILNLLEPIYIVDINGTPGVCKSGNIDLINNKVSNDAENFQLQAYAPPLHPKKPGNPNFKKRYGLQYAYIAGAMAHGIASVELVKAAGKLGMIGFFGAAGLSINELEKAVVRLKSEAADMPFGLNLIYSNSVDLEFATVNLYLKHHIRLISAAGYLKLTLPLLYYRISGIHQNADGTIICPNKIIAKTSRIEIARQFLSPAPEKLIQKLIEQRLITEHEAVLAKHIPVADDLTAEADSGGHTDNRAAISLLPAMLDLRDVLFEKFNYTTMPCIGLGGGIATPLSVSAAFSMGADYVLSGSINQSCIESGTSETAKTMLSNAAQTDVAMAPSANMFERGIKVQVLKKGTLFPQRAAKLYKIYRNYESFDQVSEKEKNEIEEKILQTPFDAEWASTRQFFKTFDPTQLALAEKDPKRKMGMVFRSYLGKSSKWAISGDASRKKDFQIWCGPSMGAFNEWAKGSFLENPENRFFQTISLNLLFGACVAIRRQWIINTGFMLPPQIGKFKPLAFDKIKLLLQNNI